MGSDGIQTCDLSPEEPGFEDDDGGVKFGGVPDGISNGTPLRMMVRGCAVTFAVQLASRTPQRIAAERNIFILFVNGFIRSFFLR